MRGVATTSCVTTASVTISPLELMQTWRRQIGQRARVAECHGPRSFAVVGYRFRGPVVDGCVPLRNLTLVALFDECLSSGALATRLIGVAGSTESNVVRFGGPALSRFEKDLRLAPAAGGRGPRLDTTDGEFLSFALQLERYLERCARHPFMPRRMTPRLPVLSAENAVFDVECLVDLATLPKRQVLAIDEPATDLRGRFGSTEFDFYNTRFRVGR